MQSIPELCCYYIAFIRSVALIHQNSHWRERGKNFYGNHLLFERIYNTAQKDADLMAEKFIGVFGDDCLDLGMQAQLIAKTMAKFSKSDPVESSLAAEKAFLELSQKVYDTLKAENKLTLGVDDALMTVASSREEACYLLGQVQKNGAKNAGRKTLLRRLAVASNKITAFDLEYKLRAQLMAIVPSYVQGKYTDDDFKVSVDMNNKKIYGFARLPKPASDQIKESMEQNFIQYAQNLLGDDVSGWNIGFGSSYFMPPKP